MNPLLKKIKALLGIKNELVTDDDETTSEATVVLAPYNQISAFVGEGNTKEALQLLTECQGHEDYALKLLQERFDSNEEHYNAKRIDFEEYRITLAQINYALLQMMPQNDKKMEKISPERIHKLLKKDKIKEALDVLAQANYEDVVMLKAGFTLAQKALADKRLTEQTWQLEKNRTTFAIMSIVEIDKKAVDKFDVPLNSKETIKPLVESVQSEAKKILSATDKLHILQLLQLNKTKEALHFCKGFGNSFLLLLGNYNQVVNYSKMGLITEADKKQQLEAINEAIQHLIA
jgi:hypothetical protein